MKSLEALGLDVRSIDRLHMRELEVLHRACDGQTYAEIADATGQTLAQVHGLATTARKKLGTRKALLAARMLIEYTHETW